LLLSNAAHLRGSSQWIRFPRVVNREWVHWKTHADGRRVHVVLMGDAAHTAHFSIGSGTKLALEDAIELANSMDAHSHDLAAALAHYTEVRSVGVLRIQNAARNSTEWFEHVDRYASFEPEQFAYSVLTRSQRISHENLRERDAAYLSSFEDWLAARAGIEREPQKHSIPPMFTPFRLRGVTLKNRVVVSPMAQYSAVDGVAGDYHLMHLGARAMGGAGLVMTEMTCVSAEARITPGCPGMYAPEHLAAWSRIVQFVHTQSDAKIGMQLGHAGAKASTRVAAMSMQARAEGDVYVLDGDKTWISNGGIADFYVVFSRTAEAPGARGISAFIVDADTPGLQIAERIDVIAPHPLARLHFASARVPRGQMLGAPGEGFKIAMRTLDIFRTSVAAASLGFARRAMHEALERAASREMFGQTLGDFQLTQTKLAQMALTIDSSALLVYRAAWLRDQGEGVTREAAMAKWRASESAQQVIDAAVQLWGGMGVQSGTTVERLYREIRSLRIYEGATEVQQLIVGRDLLKAHAAVQEQRR
jgi:alkylation response protein AidB-like acyl-CoA dehydrogenase